MSFASRTQPTTKVDGVNGSPRSHGGTEEWWVTGLRPVTEIERLTGLAFTYGAGGKKSLHDVDPLNDATTRARKQRRRRTSLMESASGEPVPEGYIEIDDLSSVVMP